MRTRRTATAIIVIATLMMAIAAPAGAATETTTRGTSALTAVPLHVESLGVPIDIGTAAMTATTDSDTSDKAPWAALGLTLLTVDGTRFGDLQASSDGDTTNEGTGVTRDTVVGSVGASAANLLALSDDTAGSATAAITSLTTEATVLDALDLSATLTDAVTSVDDTGAAGTLGVALAGIDMDLAHVLGEVLGTLPLQDLIAIAHELGIEVPVDLSSADAVVTATEDLLTAVAAATTSATTVEDAANALLTADDGALATLQGYAATIDTLLTQTTFSPSDLTTVNDILADPLVSEHCELDSVLTLDTTVLETVEQCVDDAIIAHLNTLTDEYEALSTAIDEYIAAVTAALDAAAILESDSSSLSEIVNQIQTLLDSLLAADLADIGPIEITQQTRAIGGQLDASSASHTCNVTSVTALGGVPLEIADCDPGDGVALGVAVTRITESLGAIFETIGGVDAGDGIALQLFGTVEDTVTEGDDGFVRATSVMEVLRLTVPDVTITPCDIETLGELVCALGIDLDGPLSDALAGVDGALTAAHVTVTDALATVEPITTALETQLELGPLADVTVVDGAQATVDSAVATLQAAIDALVDGLGDLGTGGGVTVPGVNIVVDPQLESEHQVTTATVDDPTPADPAPDPPLPNTGGGAALLAVLALGGGTWLWRSRRREG